MPLAMRAGGGNETGTDMDNDAYVTYHGNAEADREIAQRTVLFIDNETAARVLTMEDTIAVVEESYREWGLGRATATRATHSVPRAGGDGWYTWDPMASALPGMDALAVRMKSDILPPSGAQVKKYCVAPGKFCGLIVLFSTEDGAPLAIMNDGHIQHMRVGAAGAISVRHMAREDAAVLGLYGTAGMATAHALAIAKVRPIREIRVYSPNPEHRAAFAERTGENMGIPVAAVDDPRQVMEGADIVAACTNSLAPVIKGEWLEPGMHVLAVLPNEIDDDVFRRSHRYVYSRTPRTDYHVADPEQRPAVGYEPIDQEWLEREDRLLAREKRIFLSDVVLGTYPGRAAPEEVTCFVTQGIPIQFAAAARKVYDGAREQGLGHELPLSWFLQDISD